MPQPTLNPERDDDPHGLGLEIEAFRGLYGTFYADWG